MNNENGNVVDFVVGDLIKNIPKNPLIDKWSSNVKKEDGTDCDAFDKFTSSNIAAKDYKCISCTSTKCCYSCHFKMSKEDSKVYDNYIKELEKYQKDNYFPIYEAINTLSEMIESKNKEKSLSEIMDEDTPVLEDEINSIIRTIEKVTS